MCFFHIESRLFTPANLFGQGIKSFQKDATNFLKASEGCPWPSLSDGVHCSVLLYVTALKRKFIEMLWSDVTTSNSQIESLKMYGCQSYRTEQNPDCHPINEVLGFFQVPLKMLVAFYCTDFIPWPKRVHTTDSQNWTTLKDCTTIHLVQMKMEILTILEKLIQQESACQCQNTP